MQGGRQRRAKGERQRAEGRAAYGGGGGLLVDAVVVDAALAAHGDAQLTGTALRVPAQSAHRTCWKATLDASLVGLLQLRTGLLS